MKKLKLTLTSKKRILLKALKNTSNKSRLKITLNHKNYITYSLITTEQIFSIY